MNPVETDSTLPVAWKSFWQAMIDRIPHEGERSKQATGHSYRHRPIEGVNGIMISMFLDDKNKRVGVFVRDPKDEQNSRLIPRLQPLADVLESELKRPLIEKDKRFLFVIREDGDFKDQTKRAQLIKWLADTSDRYEQVFREVLGDGGTQEDDSFGEDDA